MGINKQQNQTFLFYGPDPRFISNTCSLRRWMHPTWHWAFSEKTSRFQRTSESDMAPKPRGSGASVVKSESPPSKLSHWTAEISAEARVSQSHGHGTSKECGPTNSCRSRNYFLSFGLIVTFARCGSFMTCTWVPPLKIHKYLSTYLIKYLVSLKIYTTVETYKQ